MEMLERKDEAFHSKLFLLPDLYLPGTKIRQPSICKAARLRKDLIGLVTLPYGNRRTDSQHAGMRASMLYTRTENMSSFEGLDGPWTQPVVCRPQMHPARVPSNCGQTLRVSSWTGQDAVQSPAAMI